MIVMLRALRFCMRLRFSVLLSFLALSVAASPNPQQPSPEPNSPTQPAAAPADAPIVYVSDSGLDARRLGANSPLPKAGVRVRGVFAEADEMNRARRLLVGGETVGPNIILYVGVNNLKNPEQPLYVLADPPANDARHGPVITVTSYSPAARYELSRDPSGEELQKVSQRIAADLSALVSA